MNILEIIGRKKNGFELSSAEIEYVVDSYCKELIPDYQMSALLMAICWRGCSDKETFSLTNAMLKSAKKIYLKRPNHVLIDKHSSGGVGDKVTLIFLPLMACFGVDVHKLSGRALGFTGGTIDKLESIKMQLSFDDDTLQKISANFPLLLISSEGDLVPADKKLYALRDVTSTVDSIPLIAASIMSKKLIVDSDYIFFDIKVGDGALMKTLSEAKILSKLLIKIAHSFNRTATVHITDMQHPLGQAIGNAIEVKEAIAFLKNQSTSLNLETIIYEFVADALLILNKFDNKKKAIDEIKKKIVYGEALEAMYSWIKCQSGDFQSILNNTFFSPRYTKNIYASGNGYLDYLSAKTIGEIAMQLGAGRMKKNDDIDYQAGIYLHKKNDEYVQNNEMIATLHSSKPIKNELIEKFKNNIVLKNQPNPTKPLILDYYKEL